MSWNAANSALNLTGGVTALTLYDAHYGSGRCRNRFAPLDRCQPPVEGDFSRIPVMSISTCPIATINAPIERVWEFLAEPANYDLWWAAKTRSIVPEGRAQAGQRVHAKAGGFNILLTVDAVDTSKHKIDFTTKFPFGITGFNHLTCAALHNSRTQVSFG
jgi:hypothetical protein